MVQRFTVAALAVAGFALGPVLPTALAWANQLFGGRCWVSGSLIAVSMVEAVLFTPPLGATLAGDTGISMFALVLARLSLLVSRPAQPYESDESVKEFRRTRIIL